MINKNFVLKGMVVLLVSLVVLQNVFALSIEEVEKNPEKVSPGEEVEVLLTITNNRDKKAENVRISLDLSNIPLAPRSNSERFLEDVDDDDRDRVRFNLIVSPDAEAGVYKIPVLITYDLGEDEILSESTISVQVSGVPEFIVSAEGTLISERKNELDVRITNVGLSEAKLLEVSISESAGYDILSNEKVYLGDLDSDDFDTASFDIFSKRKGVVTVPVLLKYRDSTNKVLTENVVLPVRVYSEEEAIEFGLIKASNTYLYIGIVLFLIVVYLVYRRIKKNRKRR